MRLEIGQEAICIFQGRGDVGLSSTEAVRAERRAHSGEMKSKQGQQDLVLDCGVETEDIA